MKYKILSEDNGNSIKFKIFNKEEELAYASLEDINDYFKESVNCLLLSQVFTKPDFRRKGLATILYRHIKEYAKENNKRIFRGAHLKETDKIYKNAEISLKKISEKIQSSTIKEEWII